MIRWIVCPVIDESNPDGGTIRYPKIARMTDPGTGFFYRFSAALVDGKPRCVCFVRGRDFTPIDADAECIDPFENVNYEDADNRLLATPASLGWTPARQTRLRNRLIAWGVDVTGITSDTPLWQVLRRVMQTIHPSCQPQGMWVTGVNL